MVSGAGQGGQRSVSRDKNMGKSKEEIGKIGEVRGIENRKERRVRR
jgi:hypothetical protein